MDGKRRQYVPPAIGGGATPQSAAAAAAAEAAMRRLVNLRRTAAEQQLQQQQGQTQEGHPRAPVETHSGSSSQAETSSSSFAASPVPFMRPNGAPSTLRDVSLSSSASVSPSYVPQSHGDSQQPQQFSPNSVSYLQGGFSGLPATAPSGPGSHAFPTTPLDPAASAAAASAAARARAAAAAAALSTSRNATGAMTTNINNSNHTNNNSASSLPLHAMHSRVNGEAGESRVFTLPRPESALRVAAPASLTGASSPAATAAAAAAAAAAYLRGRSGGSTSSAQADVAPHLSGASLTGHANFSLGSATPSAQREVHLSEQTMGEPQQQQQQQEQFKLPAWWPPSKRERGENSTNTSGEHASYLEKNAAPHRVHQAPKTEDKEVASERNKNAESTGSGDSSSSASSSSSSSSSTAPSPASPTSALYAKAVVTPPLQESTTASQSRKNAVQTDKQNSVHVHLAASSQTPPASASTATSTTTTSAAPAHSPAASITHLLPHLKAVNAAKDVLVCERQAADRLQVRVTAKDLQESLKRLDAPQKAAAARPATQVEEDEETMHNGSGGAANSPASGDEKSRRADAASLSHDGLAPDEAERLNALRRALRAQDDDALRRRIAKAAALPPPPASLVLQLLQQLPAAPRKAVYSRDDCPCTAQDGFDERFHDCVQQIMTRVALQRDGRSIDATPHSSAKADAPVSVEKVHTALGSGARGSTVRRMAELWVGVPEDVRDVVAYARHITQQEEDKAPSTQIAPTPLSSRSGPTPAPHTTCASDSNATSTDLQVASLRAFVEEKLHLMQTEAADEVEETDTNTNHHHHSSSSSSITPAVPSEQDGNPSLSSAQKSDTSAVAGCDDSKLEDKTASPVVDVSSGARGPAATRLATAHQHFVAFARGAAVSRQAQAEAAQQAEQRLATAAATWRERFATMLRESEGYLETCRRKRQLDQQNHQQQLQHHIANNFGLPPVLGGGGPETGGGRDTKNNSNISTGLSGGGSDGRDFFQRLQEFFVTGEAPDTLAAPLGGFGASPPTPWRGEKMSKKQRRKARALMEQFRNNVANNGHALPKHLF